MIRVRSLKSHLMAQLPWKGPGVKLHSQEKATGGF